MEDRHRDVGLFRYSLVREPGDPKLSKAERGALVRALGAMEHVTPDGRRIRVGRSTLDEWIRAWRAGGFEALVPKPRVVEARTPAEVLRLAEAGNDVPRWPHRHGLSRPHPVTVSDDTTIALQSGGAPDRAPAGGVCKGGGDRAGRREDEPIAETVWADALDWHRPGTAA